MALASVLAAWAMRLWHADLAVPFGYFADGKLTQHIVKGIVEHGWWWTNPDLGAPFGQQSYDAPLFAGDTLHLLAIKALSLGSGNAAVLLNAYYLLSFPLAALSAFLVLRALGLTRPVALTCATLFALAPYHFIRGEAHIFLASYWAVPVGAYLVLAVLGDRPLFVRRADARGRAAAWATRRSAATVALCVLAAMGGLYYAVFTVALVAAAGILSAAIRRRRSTLVAAGVIVALLGPCSRPSTRRR